MKHLGAIEGGGTWFHAAVGLSDGTLLETTTIPTTTPAATVAAVADFFAAHCIEAVGVGCFGPLSLNPGAEDFGCIRDTPKPGWSGFNVRGALSAALGVPVRLQTDVIAAAIGEHRFGAGRGIESLVYLTVGTGIGGGSLVNGEPVSSRLHAEMGHFRAARQPDDPFSGVCPFHGDCLEGMAAGPAIAARWGVPGEQLPAGHDAWDLTGRILADGLRTILAVLAPDRVILGGGVGGNPALWPPLLAHLLSGIAGYWPAVVPEDWLVPPGLGTRSALVGGLVMAVAEARDVR